MSVLSERTQAALKLYKTWVKKTEGVFLHHNLTSFSPSEPNTLALAAQNGISLIANMFTCLGKMQNRTLGMSILYVFNTELFKEMFSQKEFTKYTDECRESKDDT